MRLGFYARRPRSLLIAIRTGLYNRLHPGEPWISAGAIAFCRTHLRPDMRGLEWGSGRSTAWYARRVAHLTSVEHNPHWHDRVREMITGAENVALRLVPAPESTDAYWAPDNPYVGVVDEFEDESLDFVVVDGLYRQACVLRALPKIAPGGYLLVDDTRHLARLEDWRVPPSWPVVYASGRWDTDTTIWRKPA
jgi:hypothetical protein